MNKERRPRTRRLRTRTFGPVADLENHLPTEWWKELFDSLYLRTDGDVVENEANTVAEIDTLIDNTGVKPGDRVLDLCCGQGRHCMELARRGFKSITGIDRSRYLIRLARRRARKAGYDISFHEGDARKLRLADDSLDCVMIMGNSFGYFDVEEADARVLLEIKDVLRSGGTLALDLTDGDWMREHFEPRSWEWIDENYFVCRERSLAADGQRLISREVVVHAERGVIADQFYAERLYSRERIQALLQHVGFENTRIHDNIRAESDRNQDLGMMGNRIFITTRAPRKAAVQPAKGRKPTDVTVLLGDPRLPDTVKKGGQFNEEDIDTVNQLKNALGEVTGYRFRYLDNHAVMIEDLNRNPPAFVFNLCDEGYNNDAFKELHVPALLEMINIPYTGAGPACLAHCYDKALVRAVAENLDIPVPLETFVKPEDQSATLPSIFPAILKPNFGDSSIGITQNAVVHNPNELIAYLSSLHETLPNRPILVQEFLSGNEFSVGLIGNPQQGLRALPILEVDYTALDESLPRILGYESKWLPDSPYWTHIHYRETDLPQDQQRLMIDYSSRLFERLGCRDYARFDFRADAAGNIKLLEVNPNPGWCWDGKQNLMAGYAGMRYADMLQAILDAAAERIRQAQRSEHKEEQLAQLVSG
ncbi:D-alanine-D-alanine ligase [Methylohalomonas lacus]|uniref:D-alanine--D-alanine ligase n=1 Tax=Methylohalomonas lacus TaxID=398773 RepID=A0AAE3HL83_9GAMM|nr:methyltransferase domain-containing protein [Methylohalomonas lacus]MCS3902473.1 D-alanine-D-alanine ligase [Methylohalomonas lacus]